jgi:hypothetical protein
MSVMMHCDESASFATHCHGAPTTAVADAAAAAEGEEKDDAAGGDAPASSRIPSVSCQM